MLLYGERLCAPVRYAIEAPPPRVHYIRGRATGGPFAVETIAQRSGGAFGNHASRTSVLRRRAHVARLLIDMEEYTHERD
jgi:hypothetical protein